MDNKTEMENLIERFKGTDLEDLDFLMELALDLSWYWDHSADDIWENLDRSLWEQSHNPWIVLKTVSFDKLKTFLADQATKEKIRELDSKKKALNGFSWFHETHANSPLSCVAYFCMEFMLSEALPIYSGGLGNVAGDQLKEANDLGVPVVGVGLLYQRGYFRQAIDREGGQQELYPHNDPGQLPILPLRKPNGEWLRLKVAFPGYSVWLRAWEVWVGKVKLYLLDSNDVANNPAHRGITSELYGGGPELRLQQEIVLGIGGWRLLKELNIEPEICHLNEGHSAFALLERTRYLMQDTSLSFEAALSVTRAGNLFTTHTAVPAGFDRFPPSLIEHYFSTYAPKKLGISLQDFLALGRLNPMDSSEPFNMAYLALRGSGTVNGVSRLHGEVSRNLFQPHFPRWPKEAVPVGHVTNGVHMRSWDSRFADELWTEASGKPHWVGTTDILDEHIQRVSDEKLWEMRTSSRKLFIAFIRKRLPLDFAASGASSEEVEHARHLFDPHTLTLGFARRFASYKRPNLLLYDQNRLLRIITNPSRPIQIVVAGKAHPKDLEGKALIKEWVSFSRRKDVRSHIIFLGDYNMYLAGQMVQGVDVWLNNPRRPWEASGTSGMKVLVNGGLNLSELDGWWNEAFQPEVGWALGDGQEHGNEAAYDAAEAEQLYDLLENEVVPEFYNRDESGIPHAWTAKIRNSMSTLTPRFSTNRTLIEYTEKYYLPAAAVLQKRLAANGEAGSRIVNQKHALRENWGKTKFGEVHIERVENGCNFMVQVFLEGINQEDVLVELYADGNKETPPALVKMNPISIDTNGDGTHSFQALVDTSRNPEDYTVRMIPHYEGISVPLEDNLILWQR
jgi:starch phosphorylase